MSASAKPSDPHRRWRRIGLGGVALAGLMLVGLVGILLWLTGTETGREKLAFELSHLLSGDGTTVVVGDLRPGLSGRLEARDIAVADAEGTWLRLERLWLEWSPWALLGGRLHLRAVELQGLSIPRPPETAAEDPGAAPGLPVSVSIDRARLTEAWLGAPVLGFPVAFRAAFDAQATPAGDLSANLDIARSDGVGGRLQGSLRYTAAESFLRVEMDGEEPAGGVIATLLDVPDRPPARIELRGEGPLDGWSGRMQAAVGEAPRLDAWVDLGVAGTSLTFTLDGQARPGPLSPPALRDSLESLDLRAKGRFEQAEGRLTLGQARVASKAAALTLSGQGWPRLDLAGAIDLRDPSVMETVIPDLSIAPFSGTFALRGRPATPRLEATATASRLALNGLEVTDTRLTLSLDSGAAADRWPLTMTGSLTVNALPGMSSAPGRLDIEGHGWLAPDIETLSIDTLRVRGNRGEVSAQGTAVLAANGPVSATGQAVLSDLSLVPQAALRGSARAGWRVRWDGDTVFALDGQLADLQTDRPAVDAVLGPAPRLTVSGRQTADGLFLETLRLEGHAGAATGQATLDDDFRRLDAEVRADLSLEPLGTALGRPLAGQARLAARLAGPSADPGLGATLVLETLTVEGTRLGQAQVRAQLARIASGPEGPVSVDATTPWGDLNGTARLRLEPASRLHLDTLTLAGAALEADGNVTLELEPLLARGHLKLRAASLKRLGEAVGQPLAGSLEADLDLAPRDGNQGGTVSLSTRRLAVGTLRTEEAALRLSGVATGFRIDGRATGKASRPWTVSFGGEGNWREGAGRLTVETLQGRLADHPLGLKEPLRLSAGGGGLRSAGGTLALGEGRLRLAFDGTESVSLEARALPVAAAAVWLPMLDIPGRIDLDARGDLKKGRLDAGRAGLSVTGLTPHGGKAKDVMPATLTVQADLATRQLSLEGRLEGPWQRPLVGAVSLPLKGDGGDGPLPLPADDAPVSGRLTWAGDLKVLRELLPLAVHDVAGRVDVDATLAGTLAEPAISGQARLTGGRYENLDTGTLIRDLEATARAEGSGRIVVDLTGTDGGEGRLNARGTAQLREDGAFRAEAAIDLARLAVVRRDDLRAVASGRLTFEGQPSEGKLAGRLVFDGIEARILEGLPPTVETLEISGAPSDEAAEGQQGAAGHGIMLDLVLDVPGKAFLRGRGLASEWAGTVRIGGSLVDPDLRANLSVVRGTLSVVGRSFDITAGRVELAGSKAEPRIDLTAVHERRNLRVVATVAGPASAPRITLASTPPLPEDEILAALLFNKRTGELSPTEALQIAQGLATLAGQGPGITDQVREKLGLDTLATETEGKTSRVKAGKYATDEVFVGVSRSSAADSGKATVEVEVTPQVTVETEMGQDAQGNIGVNWKHRY